MTAQEFKGVLETVLDDVHHFEAYQKTQGEYIVWQETGGRSSYGDGTRLEVVRKYQVELYTREEYTKTIDRLLEVLEENDVAFQEPVIELDRETKRFRYIVECEVA